MRDDEIRSHFDGQGLVEMRLGTSAKPRAEEIAHALGYQSLSSHRIRRGVLLLVFRRDDDPRSRHRAERTIERLRAGGPVLAVDEPPLPPPPAPTPPLTLRPQAPRPQRSLEPQPPPPVGPPRPRIPPRPPYPPPPAPPPSATPDSSPQ